MFAHSNFHPDNGLCHSMNYVVGVDIGGTFTDCVVVDEAGAVTIGKSLSTPVDFSQGALDAAADAAKHLGLKSVNELLTSTRLFFHACTIGDNTLITRAGAKTGLIMTKGFGDTLHMMRGKVAEGLNATRFVHQYAEREKIALPLTNQMYHLLYEGKPAKQAIADLLAAV